MKDGSLCLINLCVKLTHLDPAMLLTGKVNSIDDLVHFVSKAHIRLNWLIQCYSSDEIMSLYNLLIVVTQANTCQTEESFITGMFRSNVNCFIAFLAVWV